MIQGTDYSFGRRQVENVFEYYRRHSDWTIQTNDRYKAFVTIDELRGWDGDGIIAQAYSDREIEGLKSLGVPVVNTSSYRKAWCFPTVSADNRAIGAMAARHLMGRNLDRFLFVGAGNTEPDVSRLAGFRDTLKEQGATCETLLYRQAAHPATDVTQLGASPRLNALRQFTFPIGIMTPSDLVGFGILEACRRLGLRCPEDVMLVGVDNDELYCNLASSTMSSVDSAPDVIGYLSAELLDRLMNSLPVDQTHVLVPPTEVVERQSTERSRYKYPEVGRALRFIRRHANVFINAADVVAAVPVSRRWLEMKFKEEVGHGIYHEIRLVHIERAKQLLKETDWSVSRVSRECGFNSSARFDATFQDLVGVSASDYRKQAEPKTGTAEST